MPSTFCGATLPRTKKSKGTDSARQGKGGTMRPERRRAIVEALPLLRITNEMGMCRSCQTHHTPPESIAMGAHGVNTDLATPPMVTPIATAMGATNGEIPQLTFPQVTIGTGKGKTQDTRAKVMMIRDPLENGKLEKDPGSTETSAPVTTPKEVPTRRSRKPTSPFRPIIIVFLGLIGTSSQTQIRFNPDQLCNLSMDATSLNKFILQTNQVIEKTLSLFVSPVADTVLFLPTDSVVKEVWFNKSVEDTRLSCLYLPGEVYSPRNEMELVSISTAIADFNTNLTTNGSIIYGITTVDEKPFPYGLGFGFENFYNKSSVDNPSTNYGTFDKENVPNYFNKGSKIRSLLCKLPAKRDPALNKAFSSIVYKAKNINEKLQSAVQELNKKKNQSGLTHNEDGLFEEKAPESNCVQIELQISPGKENHSIPKAVTKENKKSIINSLIILEKKVSMFKERVGQLGNSDWDPLRLREAHDTVMESLGDLTLEDPMTHFLLMTLGALAMATLLILVGCMVAYRVAKMAVVRSVRNYLV